MNSSPPPTRPGAESIEISGQRSRTRPNLAAIAVVFASLFVFAAVTAPVPGPNEPHYLSKGRHYWDPSWCRGDLFLESADVHAVFYQTVGCFTQWLTLVQTAWIGRGAALLLLAVGWTVFVSKLAPAGSAEAGRWASVWAVWAYLLLAAVGDFSGEWMVGGVEGKVFSYGFVFIGLALACNRSWIGAAAAFGAAISFHPVVGGWSTVCATLALIASPKPPEATDPDRSFFKALVRLTAAAAMLVVCALPGLVPALELLLENVPPDVAFEADSIQIFNRLPHHLNPERFGLQSYLLYGGLAAFWVLARRGAGLNRSEAFFARFVAAAAIVALIGLAVGWGARPPENLAADDRWPYALRMKFLKLYPFRLVDIMLPVAVSLVMVGWALRWLGGECCESRRLKPTIRRRAAWAVFGASLVVALLLPTPLQKSRRITPQQYSDWKNACRWIAAETPKASLFITHGENLPFKWYAERPEYVSYKDCPQDALGIVEWNRRLKFLRSWSQASSALGFSKDAVDRLRRDTRADYLVASRLGPFEMEPVYRNTSFRVYKLKP
jgi:hypothetical protein